MVEAKESHVASQPYSHGPIGLRQEQPLPPKDAREVVMPMTPSFTEAVHKGFGPLRFVPYRFRLRFREMAMLPTFKGATLRGGIKSLFREQFCEYLSLKCGACMLQAECAFPRLFEASSKPDDIERRGQTFGTMSFVLQPPTTRLTRFPPGSELTFGAVIVGPQLDTFPYLLCVLQELGDAGLGSRPKRKQGTFSLLEVEAMQADGQWVQVFHHQEQIIPAPHAYVYASDIPMPTGFHHKVKISFASPVRLGVAGGEKKDGKREILSEFDFFRLFSALGRRISFLLQDQEQRKVPLDYSALFATAKAARVESCHFDWFDWKRFSTRTERHMRLDGVTGSMTVSHVSSLQLWLLRLGEFLHVGKQNSFGMGQIKVEVLEDE